MIRRRFYLIKEFDIVKLKTGEKAVIMDIVADRIFIAEINPNKSDERIDEIRYEDIIGLIE